MIKLFRGLIGLAILAALVYAAVTVQIRRLPIGRPRTRRYGRRLRARDERLRTVRAELARRLEGSTAVRWVRHPFLDSHPHVEIARRHDVVRLAGIEDGLVLEQVRSDVEVVQIDQNLTGDIWIPLGAIDYTSGPITVNRLSTP